MNTQIIHGRFWGTTRTYRSKDGRHVFSFNFIQRTNYIDIYCPTHPSLNGRDSDPYKTHLFRSGKVCFVAGQEPKSQARAEELAGQWAEYFIEYRRTGKTRK